MEAWQRDVKMKHEKSLVKPELYSDYARLRRTVFSGDHHNCGVLVNLIAKMSGMLQSPTLGCLFAASRLNGYTYHLTLNEMGFWVRIVCCLMAWIESVSS